VIWPQVVRISFPDDNPGCIFKSVSNETLHEKDMEDDLSNVPFRIPG
jgi:hypothetical protein